jgi:hypothetical protein
MKAIAGKTSARGVPAATGNLLRTEANKARIVRDAAFLVCAISCRGGRRPPHRAGQPGVRPVWQRSKGPLRKSGLVRPNA